jgi:glucuronosyltransferase
MINTLLGIEWRVGRMYYYLPGQDAIMRNHFNDSDDMASIAEIEYTTSLILLNHHLLILLNHHFSINYPRPLMPNLVKVDGMHVRPPKKISQV